MQQNPTTDIHSTHEHSFRLHRVRHTGLSIIRLAGSVTLEQSSAFESALVGMTQGMDDRLVLDLFGLSFINVVGLGVIARAGSAIRARGGQMMLTGAQHHICQLIATVHLYELFPPIDIPGFGTADTKPLELAHCA